MRVVSGLAGAAAPWGDAVVVSGGGQDGVPGTLGAASPWHGVSRAHRDGAEGELGPLPMFIPRVPLSPAPTTHLGSALPG